jgi:hypothetical protein
MSIATQLHGLKYFAPIAASRLYEHRSIFSTMVFATSYTQHLTLRPSVHMPRETSPEQCRMSYKKPRTRSKSEKSPPSNEKHGFLNRHADYTPVTASAPSPLAKIPPAKSIFASEIY